MAKWIVQNGVYRGYGWICTENSYSHTLTFIDEKAEILPYLDTLTGHQWQNVYVILPPTHDYCISRNTRKITEKLGVPVNWLGFIEVPGIENACVIGMDMMRPARQPDSGKWTLEERKEYAHKLIDALVDRDTRHQAQT